MQIDGEEISPEDESADMEVDKEDDTNNLSDDNKDRPTGASRSLSDKKTEITENNSSELQEREIDADTRDDLKPDQFMESELYLNQNNNVSAHTRKTDDEITIDLAQKDSSSENQPINPTSVLSWRNIDGQSRNIAHELCESLRTILEPTQASKLQVYHLLEF